MNLCLCVLLLCASLVVFQRAGRLLEKNLITDRYGNFLSYCSIQIRYLQFDMGNQFVLCHTWLIFSPIIVVHCINSAAAWFISDRLGEVCCIKTTTLSRRSFVERGRIYYTIAYCVLFLLFFWCNNSTFSRWRAEPSSNCVSCRTITFTHNSSYRMDWTSSRRLIILTKVNGFCVPKDLAIV